MKQLKNSLLLLWIAAWSSEQVHACATCYGQSDSKMAEGMSWGILTLVAVAYSVLIGIAAFFGFLIYRSNKLASQMEIPSASETEIQS